MKSNIWICTCVHLLMYMTGAVCSSKIGNPITDDIKKISLLKQNIPKDYKIEVCYISKDVSDMCWVKLNIFHLEVSLKDLALKFGNISSNKENLSTFVQILQEIRYHMGNGLEGLMLQFECHYRKEMWLTGKYFEFVEDFFNTASLSREVEDCETLPCPTSTKTTSTSFTTASSVSRQFSANEKHDGSADDVDKGVFLPKVVECSLMSLLLISFIAGLFLLLWKIKSRRNVSQTERSVEESPALFSGEEPNAAPSDAAISEKNRLNVIRTV